MQKTKHTLHTLLAVAVGLLATAAAVGYAYECRGYFAYGSEWMVFPLMIYVISWLLKADNTEQE